MDQEWNESVEQTHVTDSVRNDLNDDGDFHFRSSTWKKPLVIYRLVGSS